MTPKKLRTMRGKKTQQEVANLLCVQRSKICEWEKGTRKIPGYIERLIECLQRSGELADQEGEGHG